jgi:hypothetical protein
METILYALIEGRIGHENFGKPFYIGIGTQSRPQRHLALAKSKAGHRNWRLHEVLASHRSIGIVPEIEVLATFATKDEADAAEREHIARWGRFGIEPDGILCNLASGGQGPDAALMQMPEIRQRNAEAQKKRLRSGVPEGSRQAIEQNAVDPAINAVRAAASTAMNNRTWADPEIRARRIAAMKGKKKTRSQASDDARRANAKKAQSKEAQEKRTAELKARWADPEKRARMIAARAHGTGGKKAVPSDPVERDGEHSGDSPA